MRVGKSKQLEEERLCSQDTTLCFNPGLDCLSFFLLLEPQSTHHARKPSAPRPCT